MGICRREFGACLAGVLAARLLPAAVSRPKLLVLVVLEEFRSDYLEQARSQLTPGGFRFFLEKGVVFPDCRNLASTFPASSIATVATGSWPAQHGIVADYWYDRALRKEVRGTEEDYLATTLSAQILKEPDTSVTVVGLDETHAALFAGSPDARIYWMDVEGQIATRGEVPVWLAGYNSQNLVERFHGAKWLALGARPDAPALRILEWSGERPQEFMALYRSSPFGLNSQFEFVTELIQRERLGQGSGLDFLCILEGSSELLGYETGARGPLMRQMVLQIDRRLEILIAQLTKTLGENGFNLAVVGAHGAPPDPGPDLRESMVVDGEKLAQAVDSVLLSRGAGRVERYIYPFFYLDTTKVPDPDRARLLAARAALEHPSVTGYYTLNGEVSVTDEWAKRFRNSFHPERSGDFMVSYRPDQIEKFGENRGVSYGSLYNYDVRVPLMLYGPQFRPGIYHAPVESVDLAPTLAQAIGSPYPSSSTGRALSEAFAG
jgi:Type I phosphodiesterase / nucleotide pyrophosphatase